MTKRDESYGNWWKRESVNISFGGNEKVYFCWKTCIKRSFEKIKSIFKRETGQH